MIYGMIYVGVFLVVLTTRDMDKESSMGSFVGDLICTAGWGTLGSAAVMVIRGLHFN